MMTLFKSKTNVPPSSPITMTLRQYENTVRTRPIFTQYAGVVGLERARQALNDSFAQQLLFTPVGGFWAFGDKSRGMASSELRFQDATALSRFMNCIEPLFSWDINRIEGRIRYLSSLIGEADAHVWSNALDANTDLIQSPPPAPAVHGRPVMPPKTPRMIEQSKAIAWLTAGVQGDRNAYTQALFKYGRYDGRFPLGADNTMLLAAWRQIVPIAPAYRGWSNVALQQKYPSNLGGLKLLDDVFGKLALRTMPPQGDNAWYDLALYVFGAVMTVQGFTDGNKRAARLAYVLMLLSGGVPIRAPKMILGIKLANM